MNDFYNELIHGLIALNVPYTQDQVKLCEDFYHHYYNATNQINISTIKDPSDFIKKHILDTLTAYSFIKPYQSIADLGSGGGVPGMILGIFFPHLSITLIDVIEKKVQYLNKTIQLLHLKNLCAYNASRSKVPGTFDLIVTRAIGSLKKILIYSKPYISTKTHILAYKGKQETIDAEVNECKKNINIQVYPVKIPHLDVQRHIVVLKSLK